MNLSPPGKHDTLAGGQLAGQRAVQEELARLAAREATPHFLGLLPSAQDLQQVEWELEDLLAEGERGEALESHDADVLVLQQRIARLTAAQPAIPASKSAAKKKAAPKKQAPSKSSSKPAAAAAAKSKSGGSSKRKGDAGAAAGGSSPKIAASKAHQSEDVETSEDKENSPENFSFVGGGGDSVDLTGAGADDAYMLVRQGG